MCLSDAWIRCTDHALFVLAYERDEDAAIVLDMQSNGDADALNMLRRQDTTALNHMHC
jgi:hypothetical protein